MGCLFSFSSNSLEKYSKLGYLDSSMIEDQPSLLSEESPFEGNPKNDNRFFMMPGYQDAMKKLQAIVKSEGAKYDAGIELKYMRMQFSDYQIKLLEVSRQINENERPKSLVENVKESEKLQPKKKNQKINPNAFVKVLIKSAPIEEVPEEQEDQYHDNNEEEEEEEQGSEMFVETRTKSVPHLIEGSLKRLDENNLNRWLNRKRILVIEVQSLILFQHKDADYPKGQNVQIKLSTITCNLMIEATEEFKEKQENELTQKLDQDEWEIISKDKSNDNLSLASGNNNEKGPNESTAAGVSKKENDISEYTLNKNYPQVKKTKLKKNKKQDRYQLMQVREIELQEVEGEDRITVSLASKICNSDGNNDCQQLGISQSFQFQELINQKVHSKQIKFVNKQKQVIGLLNSRIQLICNPKELVKTQLEETNARLNQIQLLQKEVANASRPASYIEMNQNKTEQAVEISQSPPEQSTSSILFDGKYFVH